VAATTGVGSIQPPAREAPAAERKLVSVLFADLVGFTTLSESRDPEEVRDLLTRYFDTCRRLVGLYGGSIEKFIGDAVMAAWGTPTAKEDDAERAVRAALDLMSAVAALGAEVGAPELRARAGVLTGEAAVTLGAEGQGMVAGDLVNTASRIQAAAQPGTVLVGETSKRATEASIAYEDAGTFELKGKAEPVHLWRADRVIAARRGVLRATGLEPPFVGRDREMRLVKELFHATAEESKAHLISVIGVAGVGKSRLSWEFEKYIDGIDVNVLWHRGRCLAYGESIAYWALAEMVRMRCRIVEDDSPETSLAKMRETIQRHIRDPDEQRWLEPRLLHLLQPEEGSARDPQDLFSAWRLFFERLSEEAPTVMVFEDLQWADAALLDFVEYLLDWSRDHPLYLMTLARPELADRRPTWGAGSRNFSSLYLEPLMRGAMEEMLSGLVPGLPAELREQILERAEGIPLYAVETVRMLLDRGLLIQEGDRYFPTGPIEALEVPETLHALIAARLDGLSSEERRLLQDAAVMGKAFTRPALAALTAMPEPELESMLSALVRKELLSVQADRRSPEHGQYGFLQDLVRRVAYETLSKKDRKARHLAAADYLQTTGEESELAEKLSSHLLEAYRAAPGAPDASEIKARARDALARAGSRAASLGAGEEGQRYFEQAAELADDPVIRAELLERAGEMAVAGGRMEAATNHFQEAMRLFEREGRSHPAARVSARLGDVEWDLGRLDDAISRMERAFTVLSDDPPDQDLAMLAAQLGRLHFFKGEMDLAAERIEVALDIGERLRLSDVISQALNTKAIVAMTRGHSEESLALVGHALKVALDHDIPTAALRGYFNLAENLCRQDRYEEALGRYTEALAVARKVGNRYWEIALLAELPYPLFLTGNWDEALGRYTEIPESVMAQQDVIGLLSAVPDIHLNRGEAERARGVLDIFARYRDSDDVQERAAFQSAVAVLLRGEGRYQQALEASQEALDIGRRFGAQSQMVKAGFVEATESAFALGDLTKVDELLTNLEGLSPGVLPAFLEAHSHRFQGRLSATRSEIPEAVLGFKRAAGMFRELGLPFWLAVTLLEHAELLIREGRPGDAEPLLGEARDIFDRLKARPWLQRVAEAEGAQAEEFAASTGRDGTTT
jgi:class 3 adenylate cyclase/tetratricopeptide (TPR) repeat protein